MSEEARGKLQTLTVQLEEAEEGLADTQYERQLSDQQRIFDHLYQSLEDYFNDRLEHPEELLASTEKIVGENMGKIKDALNKELDYYNVNLSQTLNNILGEDGIGKINTNFAKVDGDVESIKNSVLTSTAEMSAYYERLQLKEKEEAELNRRINILYSDAGTKGSFANYFEQFNTKLDAINNTIGNIDTKADAKAKYQELSETLPKPSKPITMTLNQAAQYLGLWDLNKTTAKTKYKKILAERGITISGLAKGGHVKANQLAWTQEEGLEAILRPTDNAILTPLKTGDSVLNAEATKNLWDFANNPLAFMKQNVGMTTVSRTAGVTFNNSMSPTIVVNGVTNANEFIRELQKNKQFESMIQDMTINQMGGGASLSKLKYKF